MSIGSDTVMTVAPDSHRIPYYLPGKKPFVPYFRYSVKDKYSIKGEEMQGGKKYYENKKRGALAPRFALSYYLSYQNAILSSMYFFTSAIGILSCFIESRSRTVTQPSSTLSKSYVMQKGVPISSCLLYLLPIAPASS